VGSWCGDNYNASDIEQTLNEDYTTVSGAMTTLSNSPIVGRTNIAAGIDNGIAVLTDPVLARPLAEKTMVLLTDGLFNEGREPHLAAEDAAVYKIVIHTVTFSDGADQAEMQLVAEATGGNHYHAPDAATLEAIFAEIARTLPVVLTQ
jgi:Mg-chelatase subunit ChlD